MARSALPPPYNWFIVGNGGKWSRDINQVLWSVVCRSAQKRMSDDSTQSGCANKEHQTNYSQSDGANSHSVFCFARQRLSWFSQHGYHHAVTGESANEQKTVSSVTCHHTLLSFSVISVFSSAHLPTDHLNHNNNNNLSISFLVVC